MNRPSLHEDMASEQTNTPNVHLSRHRSPSAEFENPLYLSDRSWYDSAGESAHSQVSLNRLPDYDNSSTRSNCSGDHIHITSTPPSDTDARGNFTSSERAFVPTPPSVNGGQHAPTRHTGPLSPQSMSHHTTLDESVDSVQTVSSGEFLVPTQMSDSTASSTSALSPHSVCSILPSATPLQHKKRGNTPYKYTSPSSSKKPTNVHSPSPAQTHSPMTLLFHQSVLPPIKNKKSSSPATNAQQYKPQKSKPPSAFNPFLAPPFTQSPPDTVSTAHASVSTTVSTLPPSSSSSAASSAVSSSSGRKAQLHPPVSIMPPFNMKHEDSHSLPQDWMQRSWAPKLIERMLRMRKAQGFDDSKAVSTPLPMEEHSDALDTSGLFTEDGGIDFRFFDRASPSTTPTTKHSGSVQQSIDTGSSLDQETLHTFRRVLERVPGVSIIPSKTDREGGIGHDRSKTRHPAELLFFSQGSEITEDGGSANTTLHGDNGSDTVIETPVEASVATIQSSGNISLPDNEGEQPTTAVSRLDVAFQRMFGALWDSFDFSSQGVVNKETGGDNDDKDDPSIHSISAPDNATVLSSFLQHSAVDTDSSEYQMTSTQETIMSSDHEWDDREVYKTEPILPISEKAIPNNTLDNTLDESLDETNGIISGWGGAETSAATTTSSASSSTSSCTSSYDSIGREHSPSVYRYRRHPDKDIDARGSNFVSGQEDSDEPLDAEERYPVKLEELDHPIRRALIDDNKDTMEIKEETIESTEPNRILYDTTIHTHGDINPYPMVPHTPSGTKRRIPMKSHWNEPSQSLLSPPMRMGHHSGPAASIYSPPETPLLPPTYTVDASSMSTYTTPRDRKRHREVVNRSTNGHVHVSAQGRHNAQEGQTRSMFSPDPQVPRSKRMSTHDLRMEKDPVQPSADSHIVFPGARVDGQNFGGKVRTERKETDKNTPPSHIGTRYSRKRVRSSIFIEKRTQTQLQFPKSPMATSRSPSSMSANRKPAGERASRRVHAHSVDDSDSWIDSRQRPAYQQVFLTHKR